MNILFTSDLHGKEDLYKQLVVAIKDSNVEVLILGGDQSPIHSGINSVKMQKQWLEIVFKKYLIEINKYCRVFWISGNHDYTALCDIVDEYESHGLLFNCNLRQGQLTDNLNIIGFPYLPLTIGWPIKDWERADTNQILEEYTNIVGYVSDKYYLKKIIIGSMYEKTPDMNTLIDCPAINNSNTNSIIVTHCPPYDSGLDTTSIGINIGSKAIYELIRSKKVGLSLHGHVHESPYITKKWYTTLNKTICVNPGQIGSNLHAVVFNSEEINKSLYHTVFGPMGSTTIGDMPEIIKPFEFEMKV